MSKLLLVLSFLLSLLLFSNRSFATHAMGGDIWYECNGGNSYTVYFAFYRDCDGVAAPNTVVIDYSSSCTGTNTLALTRIPGTGQDITPVCPGQQTACSGGNFQGVEKYVYSATVTLGPCADWVFSTAICCRNNAITNINNPGGQNMYLQATLDNLNNPCNSSPIFTSDPVPYVCVGETFCFNHGAIDAEGDSVTFSLIVPYDQGPSDPVTYNAGFSAGQPISSNPAMTFNPSTGDICMTPQNLEVSVTAVVVEHWHNGVLVGTIMRDIQIVAINCNNILPTVDGIDASNSFTTNACAGSPITFTTNGADNNAGNLLTMSWNNGVPGATFNIAGNGTTNPVGTFNWTPTLAQVSNTPYCFTVTIQDDQCPLNGFQIYSFCITVGAGNVGAVASGTDLSCFGVCDGEATIVGSGGNPPYTYSIDGINYQASNSFTGLCDGPYDLYVQDSDGCTNDDDVTLIEPTQLVITPSSTNVTCNGGNDGLAGINASGGTAPYTYSWSNGGTNASISNLTAGTYTINVTDANGCTETTDIIITEPPVLVITPTITDATCAGNDGELSVVVTGGTAPYTYGWSHDVALTTASDNQLIPNTYSVTVTDDNGCAELEIMTVGLVGSADASFAHNGNQCLNGNAIQFTHTGTAGGGGTHEWDFGDGLGTSTQENPLYSYPSAGTYNVEHIATFGVCSDTIIQTVIIYEVPILSTISTNVSCFGGNDGAIDLSVSGGLPNYGYSWSTGSIAQDVSNLSAGTHTVIVSDNNGCLGYDTIVITEPAVLVVSAAPSASTCANLCDGSAALTVSGGTTPYTYLWNDPLNQNTANASNLCSGSYTITVTDNNGCAEDDVAIILDQDEVLVSTTIVPSSCNQPDGELTANPTGGVGPYSYIWPSLGQITQTAINVPSGNYIVQVTDSQGCFGYDTINMSDLPAPSATIINATNVLCNGDLSGSAEVQAVGGTGVYFYQWSNGDTDEIADNIGAGQYQVVVTDDAGCIAQASVVITQPTAMNGITGSVNANCGQPDGSATILVTGGNSSGGYTYDWSDGFLSIGSSNSITSSTGMYYITVTDGNGCQLIDSVFINDNPAGTVTTLSTDETCFGSCNGTGIAVISGGTAPYQFQWDNPNNTFGPNVVGLCEGHYEVTVTDAIGCVVIDSVNIGSPSKLLVNVINQVDVTCFGYSDGSIESVASGGLPPYSYLWDANTGSQTTPEAIGLPAGSYTVVVTDANGCTVSTTRSIGQPAEIQLSAVSVNAHCNSPDGSATVSITNGAVLPVTYSWTGSTATTATATNLLPGTYTCTVTDDDGCQASIDVTVGNTPAGTATITNAVDPTCFGSCNGLAAVSMSGTGVGPYTHSWNNALSSNTVFATGLCGGVNYTATVTDANGCVSTASVTLTNPPQLLLDLTPTDAICNNECTGSMSSNVTGGTAPYSYQWNDASQQVTQTAVNLCAATNYTLTVTDAHNCTVSEVSSVGQPTPIEIDSTIVNSFCGQAIGEACITISGGIPGYDVTWLHNGATSLCQTGLASGTYLIEIADANDCPAYSSVTVTDISGPVSSISSISHVLCAGGSNGQATATVTGGTPPFNYQWDANTGNQVTPTASNLVAGSYTYSIIDSAGCIASGVAVITEPQPLTVFLNRTNPVCFNNSDGVIISTVFGGTAPFTYSWSHDPTLVTSVASGLAAGNYSLTVTDANGCSNSAQINLQNPQPLSVGVTATDLSCNGLCNGSAIALPNNGTGPYTYLWNDPNGQTSQIANGLCAGTFQLIAKDVNGCPDTVFVTIDEPDSLLSSISLAGNVSCNGACDGFAEVSGSGGTVPYSYLWSNGESTQMIENLCPGNYAAIIQDANGCSVTATQAITQPAALSGTMVKSNASCFSQCNGSAQFVVTGGTTPYTYQWNDPNFQTASTATGLCAGSYTVTVFDNNDCPLGGVVQIVQPTQINVSASVTNSNCGQNNGMACVNVSGGTSPYIYQWDDPNSQSTACALNVPSGNYQVSVTDNNNCVTYAQVNVTDLSGPFMNFISSTDVSCNGLSDGEIQMSFGGGATPYASVQWLDDQGSAVGTANNPTLSSIPEGCYTFEVIDNVGCQTSQTICVDQPDVLNVSAVNISNPSCFGACDGEATAVFSGGTGPFNVLWGNGETTTSVTNLCVGIETITITDDNGCIGNGSVTLTQPSPLTTVQVGYSQTLCAGSCNGSIQLLSLGGTAPYSYAWSPNGGTSTSFATQLCAGNYTVQTTDANGCQIITNYVVDSPPVLTGTISNTTATCGDCNGTVTIVASGGTSPYEYMWQDAQNTQIATGICSGIFEGTIIDDNGCQLDLSTTVGNVAGPTISSISTVDLNCNGDNTGQAAVTFTGGTSPYNYSWNQTTQTTASITGLAAGNHCVQITDGNGCVAFDCEIVSEPDVLYGVADLNTTICYGDSAQIWASTIGGTGPFTYTWQSPNNGLSGVGPHYVSPLNTQDYCFSVVDANGCVGANLACATITVAPQLMIDALDTLRICDGDNVDLTSIPSGGNGSSYQFDWYFDDPNTGSISSSQNLVNFAGTPGWYYVTLNDGCSLEAIDSSLVQLEPYPYIEIFSFDSIGCYPELIEVSATSDIGVLYSWDYESNGTIDYVSTDTTTVISYPGPGVYDITLWVESALGCVSSLTDSGAITILALPIADFEASPLILSDIDPVVDVFDLSQPANSPIVSWEWDFESNGTMDAFTQNATHTYNGLGEYLITLTVIDSNGCQDTATYQILVQEEYSLFVPNTFTPDDDGTNDIFKIEAAGYDQYRLELWIFDRWGQLIFFSQGGTTDGWDGTYKGELCQQDAYVWMVKVPDEKGFVRTFRGHVNLLR